MSLKAIAKSTIYDYPEIYDLLFKPYDSQIKWVKKKLRDHFPNGVNNLLDPACGSGYWLEHIKSNKATGIDISKKMVYWCKKKFQHNPKIHALYGDMRELPKFSEKFDLAINLESTVGHLKSTDEFSKHLRSMRTSLCYGGLYFLGCPLKDNLFGRQQISAEFNSEYMEIQSGTAKLKMWNNYIDGNSKKINYNVSIIGETNYPNKIDGTFNIFLYKSEQLTQYIIENNFKLISASYMNIDGIPDSPNIYDLGLTSLILKAV